MDSGLVSLALIAQLNHVAADISQLEHELALKGEPAAPQDLLRAAKTLGFKARKVSLNAHEINPKALPAIAKTAENEFFVVARIATNENGERRFLVQRVGNKTVATLEAEEFEALWTGDLILLTKKGLAGGFGQTKFNLKWFIPSLIKYKRLFGEVIVASFFLQLFALVTPLFFQVVMDKVLVHQGFTTLNVLAFGFFVIVAFDAIVGGLRNYLFSHTTNRVDVELGARLFGHLSSLPLAYFEVRQVGQTVA